jgi:hypothetical protein
LKDRDKLDLVWDGTCPSLLDPLTGEVVTVGTGKTCSQLSQYAMNSLGVREVRWLVDLSHVPENKR